MKLADWQISAIADKHTSFFDGVRVVDEIPFGRAIEAAVLAEQTEQPQDHLTAPQTGDVRGETGRAATANDRNLLEFAAKAVGMNLEERWFWQAIHDAEWGLYANNANGTQQRWNPLTDDGDALRLAATLNINISFRENINGAWVVAERSDIHFCPESLDGPHENDAMRRAIVRAAAEIGRGPSA